MYFISESVFLDHRPTNPFHEETITLKKKHHKHDETVIEFGFPLVFSALIMLDYKMKIP